MPRGAWLITLFAWIVPADERDTWRREWQGELAAHRGAFRFVLGAARHAVWLRLDSCRPSMLTRDVRFALRALGRQPAYAAAAILTLGLGIGAATAVFSVADGTLFRPLPYAASQRLVAVHAAIRARGMLRWDVPPDEYVAWRNATRHLSGLAGSARSRSFTLVRPDEPVQISIAEVTRNFLTVLGVPPALGRDFSEPDFETGAVPTMLLLDHAWRRLFDADPAIVGQSVFLNGSPATVIGVLPPSFVPPRREIRGRLLDAIAPISQSSRSSRRLELIGRLADGSTVEQVAGELDPLAASRRTASGLRDTPIDGVTVEDVRDSMTPVSQRRLMLMLFGAVVALLLIGCANVANLLLARGSDRASDLALRSALGASRRSLVRLLLAESSVLAIGGGLLGIVLAYWAVDVVTPLIPGELQQLKAIAVDGRALVFALGASTACVLVSGLFPAVRSTRSDILQTLQQSSTRTTASHQRVRQTIVGLEVSLAVLLLVGAGLMANGMIRLLGIDHGYRASQVLAIQAQLPTAGSRPPERSIDFVQRALAAVRSVPGIDSAGAVEGSILSQILYAGVYSVEGFSDEWMREGADFGAGACCTQSHEISVDGFKALGIPVLRGRAFRASDAVASPRVAIINERLARKFPRDINPVGHWLVDDDDPADRRLIVGVVGDTRDMSLKWGAPQAVYLPLEERGTSAMTLFLRTSGDPLALAAAARQAIQRGAGPVVITNVSTLGDLVMGSVSDYRLNAWLFGSFGVLGLTLAAIGIFGVVSYAVAHRTREIGVRIALGASPAGVRRLVVRQALTPVLAGLVVGLAAALGLSRYLATLLFEVQPTDAATYALMCAVLVATAIAAAYLPARRAARVDPVLALRAE